MLNNADQFAGLGTEKSAGFRDLQPLRPRDHAWDVHEAPLGITLRELLDLSGGMRGGYRLKFLDRRMARRRGYSPTST